MPFPFFFMAPFGAVPEWIFFVLIVWAGMSLVRGGRRRHRRRWSIYEDDPRFAVPPATVAPAQLPEPKTPQDVRKNLKGVSELSWGRLPKEYQAKVDRILRKVDELLKYAEQFPLGSKDLYLIQQTAADYLPTTLNSYFRLPPGYGYAPVEPEGKPALHVLWDQLCMIEQKLDVIAQGLQQKYGANLLANGVFLEQRFGEKESELRVPANPNEG